MAKALIVFGLVLVGIGALWLVFPKALSWFGHLPGDLRLERGSSRVFIPITSMLLASVVLSLVLNGVAWLLRER